MIDNCTIKLLTGGFFHADSHWSMDVNRKDHCFKLYMPTGGKATIVIDGRPTLIEPNFTYFLSGWHIEKQMCEHFLDVYWLHFLPESTSLKFLLDRGPSLYKIPLSHLQWAEPLLSHLDQLFQPFCESEKLAQRLQANISHGQYLQLQSILLFTISYVLSQLNYSELEADLLSIKKLQKAIDYMDQHFLENPSLAEVAEQVHMAPNYFHRLFSSTFGSTPFDYMLSHKLNRAKELLTFSEKSIREISVDCGYQSEFHFSRTFKKQLGLSPKNYRQRLPTA